MAPQPSYTTTTTWPPPPQPPQPKPQLTTNNGKWTSYSSSNPKPLDANMAIILIILACAAVLAFSLHAAGRLILRLLTLRRHTSSSPTTKPQPTVLSSDPPAMSPIVFSSAHTRLARAEAECAICLSEFADGERVRMLPGCGHGFHANCVEEWIAARSSCPTCRATCRLDGTAAGLEEP